MTRYLATKPDFSKEGVVSHDWLFTQVLLKEGVTMLQWNVEHMGMGMWDGMWVCVFAIDF